MKAVYKKSDDSLLCVLESTVNQSTIDGNEYSVEDLDSADFEQILNEHVRPERNRKLQESDAKWIEKSSKSEDLTAINAYKQALRDFPENLDLAEVEFIDQLEWPVEGA